MLCKFFWGFDRTRWFCMFSYVCRVPRRDLCPPPPFFLFFFFFRGCIEPKSPVTMQSDTSLGLHGALLSQLPNTSPRAAARPWWVLQVADVRATRPHAQHALIFPKAEAPELQTLQSFYVILAVFTASQSAFYPATEDYLWGPHSGSASSVCHGNSYFLTLSQGLLTNKSASQQRHFKIGFLIMVKISKAAGRGSGGKCLAWKGCGLVFKWLQNTSCKADTESYRGSSLVICHALFLERFFVACFYSLDGDGTCLTCQWHTWWGDKKKILFPQELRTLLLH